MRNPTAYYYLIDLQIRLEKFHQELNGDKYNDADIPIVHQIYKTLDDGTRALVKAFVHPEDVSAKTDEELKHPYCEI